ncbi:hypothetical protein EAY46_15350 [Vibrio anguillarum]|nr:hypothetical protein [Vibrio anguillarum]
MDIEKYIQKVEISAFTDFEFCKEVTLTLDGRKAIESALAGSETVAWVREYDLWAVIDENNNGYYDINVGDLYLEECDELPEQFFELVEKILNNSEQSKAKLQLQGIVGDSNYEIHGFSFDTCYLNSKELIIVETTSKAAFLMFQSNADDALTYSGWYLEFESVEKARQYVFSKYDSRNQNDFHVQSIIYQEIETDQINELIG